MIDVTRYKFLSEHRQMRDPFPDSKILLFIDYTRQKILVRHLVQFFQPQRLLEASKLQLR